MSKADEYKKLVEDVKAAGDRYDKAPWNITLMPPEIRVNIENGRIKKKIEALISAMRSIYIHTGRD